MKTVYWLKPDTYPGDYQFYRQWITNAWAETGGKLKDGVQINFLWKKIFGKCNMLSRLIPSKAKGKALIVCCGAFPDYAAWPYNYANEIIPIIWDCWPSYHRRLLKSINNCKIKTLFCTSSQVVEMVKAELPDINAFWLPEGIDVNAYKEGLRLTEREIDVLELGRQLPELHNYLLKINSDGHLDHKFSSGYNLLFKTFDELTEGLANSKITICYPRCDTHPEMAGDIETMTQRYWECMLSGTIIAGKAPRELIDFCGYNPVVELTDNSFDKILNILDNVSEYQELCDKNRIFALENAPWSKRIAFLQEKLLSLGYNL